MNCWIVRYKTGVTGKKEFKGYFNKNLGKNDNHWVQVRTEALLFTDGRKARSTIKKYKLKNCEVEYE